MEVELPNGVIVEDVPEDITQAQLAEMAVKNGLAKASDFGDMFMKQTRRGKRATVEESDSPASDVFRGLSQEQKTKIIAENRKSGRGSGGNANRYRKAADLERLRAENPYLAEEIESMNPAMAGLIGMGEGFASVGRGLGMMDMPSEGDEAAMDALRGQSNSATVGKFAGQALPFVPAGAGVGGLTARLGGGKIAQLLAMGALGGAEGAIISRGEGGSAADMAAGAGAGVLLGAGAEILGPALNSVGRSVIKRMRGVDVPTAVTPEGTPTPELQQAMDDAGITFDDVVQAAQVEAGAVESVARDAASGKLRNLPENVQPNAQRQAALQSFGLEDAPLGTISDNPAFVELSAGLASIPGSAMAAERKQFLAKTGEAANQLIQEYGGKLDKAGLSDDIRDYLTRTRDDLYKQEGAIYDEVRDLIPNVRINAKPLADYVRGIAKELGGESELSGLDKEILRVANLNPTYKRLDALRKEVGQALGDKLDKTVYGTKETSILSDRYSKLTELQEGVASVYGDAAEKWKIAKSVTTLRKDLEDSTVKLFGKDLTKAIMPAIGQSVKNLAKGDYQKFDTAMAMLPKAQRQEVVASALDDVFRGRDGYFSPIQFNKWYKDLARNSASRSRLEAVLPDKGKRLREFYLATEGLANLQRNVIPNGKIVAMLDSFDKQGGMLSKLMKTSGQALAAEGVGTTMGVPGVGTASVITRAMMEKKTPAIEAAQKLIQDPAFIEAVKTAGMNRPKNVVDIAEKRLQRSAAFRAWLETQPVDARSSIVSVGLIPWLISDPEE